MRTFLRVAVVSGALAAAFPVAAKPPTTCKPQKDELAAWLKRAAEKPVEAKPGPSSISSELAALDAADPSKRAPLLDKAGETLPDRVFKKCGAAFTDWMKSLSTLAPADKRAKIVAELPTRVEACGCQVEIPAVKELAYRWLNPSPVR